MAEAFGHLAEIHRQVVTIAILETELLANLPVDARDRHMVARTIPDTAHIRIAVLADLFPVEVGRCDLGVGIGQVHPLGEGTGLHDLRHGSSSRSGRRQRTVALSAIGIVGPGAVAPLHRDGGFGRFADRPGLTALDTSGHIGHIGREGPGAQRLQLIDQSGHVEEHAAVVSVHSGDEFRMIRSVLRHGQQFVHTAVRRHDGESVVVVIEHIEQRIAGISRPHVFAHVEGFVLHRAPQRPAHLIGRPARLVVAYHQPRQRGVRQSGIGHFPVLITCTRDKRCSEKSQQAQHREELFHTTRF